jgi:dCMP deaminase
MIIGLTGTKASGKGVIADFLQKKGFEYVTLSQIIKDEAFKILGHENYDIFYLQDLGNELRKIGGTGVLAKIALEKMKNFDKKVIDGIRNIGEIEEIKKQGGIIISVDAPQLERFERLIKRARNSDPKDYIGFLKMEERDLGKGENDLGQQVAKCIEESHYKIYNSGTLKELEKKIEEILDKINFPKEIYKRPSWDEYFMEIVKVVAKRATCDRGRTACVIVKNKQILVTGYVGSPKGLPHCDEAGHQIEKTKHLDGIEKDHCIRTIHAEQNAICQAAKLGIPIEGSTLYAKLEPCSVCAKMIINSGIKRIVCEKRYQAGAQSLLEQAGVKVDVLNNEIEKY